MSVFLVVVTAALLALIGTLLVDGLGRLRAVSRADALAAEAARAGGQAVDPARAIEGDGLVVSPPAAAAAAQQYLAREGVTGTVTVTGGSTIRVTVTTTYSSVFPPSFTRSVTGRGQASLLHGVTTPED
ncbi:hypothetical protein [Streptomyces alkaliterrae]|uniref:hypothetical protein n=1 Tax=Streptomyces alkaliterrae TaxID=2213162 RepID=UPI002B20FFC8|nr:hypothetical protein [Streptomyces alkaliterrae]